MKTVNFWIKFLIGSTSLMGLFCIYYYFDFLQLKSPIGDDFFGHLVEGETIGTGSKKVFSGIMSITLAISTSWAILFVGLAFRLLKDKQSWIADLMLLALIVWYITDSYASFHYGIITNVISNTIFFILIIVPLLIIRKPIKQFHVK